VVGFGVLVIGCSRFVCVLSFRWFSGLCRFMRFYWTGLVNLVGCVLLAVFWVLVFGGCSLGVRWWGLFGLFVWGLWVIMCV